MPGQLRPRYASKSAVGRSAQWMSSMNRMTGARRDSSVRNATSSLLSRVWDAAGAPSSGRPPFAGGGPSSANQVGRESGGSVRRPPRLVREATSRGRPASGDTPRLRPAAPSTARGRCGRPCRRRARRQKLIHQGRLADPRFTDHADHFARAGLGLGRASRAAARAARSSARPTVDRLRAAGSRREQIGRGGRGQGRIHLGRRRPVARVLLQHPREQRLEGRGHLRIEPGRPAPGSPRRWRSMVSSGVSPENGWLPVASS